MSMPTTKKVMINPFQRNWKRARMNEASAAINSVRISDPTHTISELPKAVPSLELSHALLKLATFQFAGSPKGLL